MNSRAITIFAATAIVLLIGASEHGVSSMILDREAILNGQWWRIFSGHFVHLSVDHLSLNALALLLLCTWGRAINRLGSVLIVMLVSAPVLSCLLLMRGAEWYAGLSGALHAGAVYLVLQLPWKARTAGLAAIGIKLLVQSEWKVSALPVSADLLVSTDSHWIGAVLGLSSIVFLGRMGLITLGEPGPDDQNR